MQQANPGIYALYPNRLKDSEAFLQKLEEERSAYSAQIESLQLKLKEQRMAHSARVKKLKEVCDA